MQAEAAALKNSYLLSACSVFFHRLALRQQLNAPDCLRQDAALIIVM